MCNLNKHGANLNNFVFCRGIVRGQQNTSEHDPEVCKSKPQDWGTTPCTKNPSFAPGGAQVLSLLFTRSVTFKTCTLLS